MKCQNCGAELRDGVRFCSECGTRVQYETPRFCRECGSPIPQDNKFCPSCGAALFEIKRNESEEDKEEIAPESEEWTYYSDSPKQKNQSSRGWKTYINTLNTLRNADICRRSDSKKTRSQKGDNVLFIVYGLLLLICIITLWSMTRNHGERIPASNDPIMAQETLSEPTETPESTPTPTPTATPTPTSTPIPSVSYSTNDKETAKKGNSGVFSYKKNCNSYNIYYVISFDEGYVYYFSDNDTSYQRAKIMSGDLNNVLVSTYSLGSESWSEGLHFKWKNQPDILIVQSERGEEWECWTTDLDSALAMMQTKNLITD